MWYQTMPLVETYPSIPRLPNYDAWFARYRRNAIKRLEPTAIAHLFASGTRYGCPYS